MSQILVFGDSITYGAWDKEGGGWVQRLRKFFDEKTLTELDFYCLIYNLGISGNTSDDLLERFEFEAKQRLGEDETIFIFSIGTNDSQFIHSQNSHKISLQKFQENIQKLTNLAEKFSLKIIFTNLLPIDETKTAPIPWNTDIFYKNKWIQKYNEIIKSICKENKIYFIDIFNKFIKLDYKKLLKDGLHPNSEGHQKIFEIVKNFLIKNKIIKVDF